MAGTPFNAVRECFHTFHKGGCMEPNHGVTGRSQEPRIRFAEELRSLRDQRGDSLRDLGRALGWDWSLFGKMEKGATLGSEDVVKALDQHYGTSGVLLTLWDLAVADTPQFKARYRRYMKLEAQATSIQKYSPCLVPGLLQTREYAQHMLMLGGMEPGRGLDQQVDARLSRHKLLTRDDGPKFRAILDESVLRRGAAGPGRVAGAVDPPSGGGYVAERQGADPSVLGRSARNDQHRHRVSAPAGWHDGRLGGNWMRRGTGRGGRKGR